MIFYDLKRQVNNVICKVVRLALFSMAVVQDDVRGRNGFALARRGLKDFFLEVEPGLGLGFWQTQTLEPPVRYVPPFHTTRSKKVRPFLVLLNRLPKIDIEYRRMK